MRRNKTHCDTQHSLDNVIMHGDTGHGLGGTLDQEQGPGEEGEAGSQKVHTDDPSTLQPEALDQVAP